MTKEIKTGYKKTPIGWIPENWKVGRFAETAQIIMGQSPDGNSYNKKGTGVPLINGPTEFTNRYPLKKQWTTKPTKMSRPGDVLLCVRGSSTGRINIANDEYCIGRGIAAIRSNGNSDTRFLEYQLHSNVSRILRLTSGSTFPNIDSKSLSSILTPIPPLPEQRKIAQILSTWDKAIELTEKLIAAKERRKKGLMQQLLTGKRRLSGFYGRWRRVKLSEMCSHIIDGTHATPKYTKSGVPFYSVENVTNNDFENVKYISKEEHEKLKRRCNPEKGDILMTRIGSIGDCKLIDWDVNAS
ncbi:hypothetical protein GWN42_21950, partial [candidate division KSB1 bacterium]|nr:hypothetical protein [candidate division KSB1 bacterium]